MEILQIYCFFSFLQGKMCTPKKSSASQKFCAPEQARSASAPEIVQAWRNAKKYSSKNCLGYLAKSNSDELVINQADYTFL